MSVSIKFVAIAILVILVASWVAHRYGWLPIEGLCGGMDANCNCTEPMAAAPLPRPAAAQATIRRGLSDDSLSAITAGY